MKRIIIVCLSIVLSVGAFAQGGKKIEAMRIAFITQRLNLTPEEAQQFWPIFNQFSEKMQQIKGSKMDGPLDEMSDADAEKMILNEFDKESRELELKKEYYQKFKKTLSVRKIAKLYRAERDFKNELVKYLKEAREERKQLKRN
jgi:Spy/CpxP family protein refolding chaperone